MKHQLHVQKKASSMPKLTPANRFQSRPFAPPTDASPPQQMPDLQTQRENAERLGYNFANIPILRPNSSPPPIQPKLTIGQPGDKYEQEADAVASQVVSRINAPETIQREEMPEEEEELQMKSDSGTIQREEMPEEDEELMMKSESGTIQREEMPEEDEELMMKSESGTIQREEMPEEEEELQMKPMVQPQTDGEMAATPDLEASIQQAKGSGQPLSDNIREPMEQAFGADFSGVKVHTDATSDQLNQSIQAKAFTTGQDVFFRQGAYQPGSRGGQELIAHELTHVVQQQRGSHGKANLTILPKLTKDLADPASQAEGIWLQRKIPTDQQWKTLSKKKIGFLLGNYKKSPEFLAIGAALTEWNMNKYDDEVTPQEKIDILSKIHTAILNWKNTKEIDTDGNVISKRIVEVERLEDEVEKKRIKIEQTIASGIESTDIPKNYSNLAVFAEGSLIDQAGNFVGKSSEKYQETKELLEQEGKATTEADIRIAMLTDRVQEAHEEMNKEREKLKKRDSGAQAVGLFVAPEWYFKRPGIPFSKSDKLKIVNAFQSLSATLEGMVIVPGSVVWREGRGNEAKLHATAVAVMNGQKLKETNKFTEGFDTRGYYRQEAAYKEKDKKRLMEEWIRGGGADSPKQKDVQEVVETDPSLFNVGSLTFSLEICADSGPGVKRALRSMQKKGNFPKEGAHVQILVSHGAELIPSNSVLRPDGIGVSTDSTDIEATNSRAINRGAVRQVFQGGLKKENRKQRLDSKNDLTQQFMGIYELPG